MNASPGETPGKNAEKGGFSASYPSRKRSVQCGPVAFVGDDQFIEDGFRHRSAGHRFRQGDGLSQFLVTALNPGVNHQFLNCHLLLHQPFLE